MNISYADDVTITVTDGNLNVAVRKMQNYLEHLSLWFRKWHFTLNPNKCSMQLFTRHRRIPSFSLFLGQSLIAEVKRKRVLGVVFDSPKLTFSEHVKYLKGVIIRKINILKALSSRSSGCSRNTLRKIYVAFIRSRLEYGCQILECISDRNLQILEVMQNTCLRLILGARQTSPILSMQIDAFIPPLSLRFKFLNLKCLVKLRQRGADDFPVYCCLLYTSDAADE